MNKVEVHPGHMLVLIEALANEVNDHLQDEQGDQDRRHIDVVMSKILAALGMTREDYERERNPRHNVYFSVEGITHNNEQIYGILYDYSGQKGSKRNTWYVYDEETHKWYETK